MDPNARGPEKDVYRDGRLIRSVYVEPPGIVTTTAYDRRGRVIQSPPPHLPGESPPDETPPDEPHTVG
jgi:hypothetical protein